MKKLCAKMFLVAFVLTLALTLHAAITNVHEWTANGDGTNTNSVECAEIMFNEINNSNRTIAFAVGELSGYLKAATGRDYTISCRETGGSGTPLVRLKLDTSLHHDGYHIYRSGKSICISGGSPRGCLYGAYMFLYEFGFRWPLPGKEFEVIPKLDDILWSGPEIKSEPAINGRGICYAPENYNIEDMVKIVDYLAKNRYNYIFIHQYGGIPDEMVDEFKEALIVRDMGLELGGHLLPKYLPRDLFNKHPEYFRMENGKRTPMFNMCPSSSEALDIMAKNSMKDWENLQDLPRLEMLHFWPDDLFENRLCSCEKCSGLSASDQILKITNEMAKRLPLGQTKLANLAYHATIYPAQKIKPRKDVQLFFCPRERCYRHVLGECKTNEKYLKWLENQIKAMPNNPEVLEYYLDWVLFRDIPVPLHPIIGKDVKIYRQAGIDRICSLAFQDYSAWAYGPNYYVFGKALWRGDGAPEDIEEYCNALFGPAAGNLMKKYYDLLFELSATALQVCGYEGFEDMDIPPMQPWAKTHAKQLAPFVTNKHLEHIESIIKAALASVEGQEPYKTRIDHQYIMWQVAKLDCEGIYLNLLANYKMDAVLNGKTNKAERLYMKGILNQAVQKITSVSEIIKTAPKELRGPYFADDSDALNFSRKDVYVRSPRAWLQKLSEQDAKSEK